MTIFRRLFRIGQKNLKPFKGEGPAVAVFKAKYANFRKILESNSELLNLISDIEEKLRGQEMFGMAYISSRVHQVFSTVEIMVHSFADLSGKTQTTLMNTLNDIRQQIEKSIHFRKDAGEIGFVLPHHRVSKEMLDWVGGKNANLGELVCRVGLPVPQGFAITTAAFDAFMNDNGIHHVLRSIPLEAENADSRQVLEISEQIQRLFEQAQVPKTVSDAILDAYRELAGSRFGSPSTPRVALRSSAIGEDSELSFAGQYLSVLNISPDAIIDAYKRVLASLFAPRAISYRIQKGVPLEATAMAVVCMEMVHAKTSGVMYTHHPFDILENDIIINAVWGLGKYAVDGVVTPDSYTLSKETPPELLGMRVYRKSARLVNRPEGDVIEEPVETNLQSRACLTEEQAKTLAGFGIRIERHFQRPQDIEWAIDHEDRIFILQSRSLRLGMKPPIVSEEDDIRDQGLPGFNVILSGGDVACPGVGCGPAWMIQKDDDMLNFPENGILVAKSPSPKFVMIMKKAQGIVTDAGSITGHMASLAREFMVPALLNTGKATELIRQGDLITIDAYSRKIYAGRVPQVLEMQMAKGAFMVDSPVFQLLKKMADLIVPLHLTDPKAPDFNAQGCRTIHDIMRLLHEKSYMDMFQISDLAADNGEVAVKMAAPRIPLDLYVIDLGGGFHPDAAGSRKVTVDQVTSAPFSALLKGMLREELVHLEPRPVSLGGFVSVMTRQMLSPPNPFTERFGDRSYVIISDKYLNFSSRVGYHYSIIDAYCGQTETDNYINFEFKGGAADDIRRNRRTRMIASILDNFGFLSEVKADRVTARIHKRDAPAILELLDQLGRLILFTRQMDMLMHTDESVSAMTECFLQEDYCLKRHS